MRAAVLVSLLLVGCVNDPEGGGTGSFSSNPTVTSSRLSTGFVTRGAPLRTWIVRFIATDTCVSQPVIELEIDLSQDMTMPPVGTFPIRAADPPVDIPSALFTSGITVDSGTVTLTAVSAAKLEGSLTAQATIGGTPTTIDATFGAPSCP